MEKENFINTIHLTQPILNVENDKHDTPDRQMTISELQEKVVDLQLKEITFPFDIDTINTNGFTGCKTLQQVRIPPWIASIEDFAFSWCNSLNSIIISSSVKSIGKSVFLGCQRLEHISVSPENPYYTSLDDVLFSKDMRILICYPPAKQYQSYSIPQSVAMIDDSAFSLCFNLMKNAAQCNFNWETGLFYLYYVELHKFASKINFD